MIGVVNQSQVTFSALWAREARIIFSNDKTIYYISNVCSTIKHNSVSPQFAIKNRFRHRSKEFPKREHWLDWASDKYDKRLIAQTKMVLRVLFLYIPLPMFWAVFDQQGSRWTLQAAVMNGDFGFQIQPDQMQIVNPILIVIMVPVVDSLVYPLIKKCKLNFT